MTAQELDMKYAAEIELRHQRNRIHQARYKMKQRQLVADFETSVKKLKEEILELELQQRLACFRNPTNTTVWGVATEFFRFFGRGVKAPVSLEKPNTWYQAQWDFLQTYMTEDVTNGLVFGAAALMETFTLQSLCYGNFKMQPLIKDSGAGDSVVATTRCSFTITESTLHYGFPHLLADPEDRDLAVLVDKLLGEKIVMKGSMLFELNSANGRVARLQWKIDLLTPMLRVLGCLEDVERVFDNSRLTLDGLAIWFSFLLT